MPNPTVPSWLNDAVFYQIYPQSYNDTNGDGIGDIPGIIEKLDYIASLGVTALWLNPCFVSPFADAGYDVADYYTVAPRYGTNADLKRLFREAKKRGIRVCLDLVAGHTSVECEWFRQSALHEKTPYDDWYIWTPKVWHGGDGETRFVNGYADRNGNYAINFFWCQPALNYGYAKTDPKHPWQQPVDAPGPKAVRAEMKKIMACWLDAGASGFRVDMASSLVKKDPTKKATIAFWNEVRDWLDRDYPEAVLVAEWGHPARALKAGFHIDFMIHFGVPGYPQLFFNEKGTWPGEKCFFDTRGEGDVTVFLDEYMKHYRKTKNRGFISIPSGNHDFQRPNTGRSKKELEVIFAFLLTWPGTPFVYYGDEIGMRYLPDLPSKEGGYERTGTRTPMQWDGSKNAGFSSAKPSDLYLPLDPRKSRPTVAKQEESRASLLNHVRRLVALRRNTPALCGDGQLKPLYAQKNKYPFVYERKQGRERVLVAVNPAGRKETASFTAKGYGKARLEMGRGADLSVKGDTVRIEMDGVAYGIWKA